MTTLPVSIESETVTLKHEALKTSFKGVVTLPEVVQYRGIKFASIAKRFARSEVVTEYDVDEVDATKSGPCPPGSKNGADMTAGQAQAILFAIPEAQQEQHYLVEDEFECLRLEITAPKHLPAGKKLPVVVFFPGGGNARAITGVRLFDYTRFVESSVKANKPIIAIHVPYRVGFLGYGVFPNGVGGNNGLYDQRNALEWIKRSISAFGGDPDNITAAGESAGGISVDAHIHAKGAETDKSLQYFKRAVLMSGTLRGLRPRSKEYHIERAKNVATALGFDGEDWAQRMETVEVEKLLEAQDKLNYRSFNLVDDGEWFEKDVVDLKKTVTPKWLESILIGDCGFEGFLWMMLFATKGTTGAIKVLESAGTTGEKIFSAYPGLQAENPQYSVLEFLRLMQDVFFSHPNHTIIRAHRAAGSSAYEYLFDQSNPWDKTRLAHHGCDLLYWFGSYDFPPSETRVCEAMKWSFFSYVNGDEPWPKDKKYGFGPDGYTGELSEEDVERRRRPEVYEIFDTIDIMELVELAEKIQAA